MRKICLILFIFSCLADKMICQEIQSEDNEFRLSLNVVSSEIGYVFSNVSPDSQALIKNSFNGAVGGELEFNYVINKHKWKKLLGIRLENNNFRFETDNVTSTNPNLAFIERKYSYFNLALPIGIEKSNKNDTWRLYIGTGLSLNLFVKSMSKFIETGGSIDSETMDIFSEKGLGRLNVLTEFGIRVSPIKNIDNLVFSISYHGKAFPLNGFSDDNTKTYVHNGMIGITWRFLSKL